MSRDPARSHDVLLLLADGPEDVVAAREAATLAAAAGTRVLAAVVLPSIGPTLDGTALAARTRTRREEANAVSGRVRPTLEELEVPLTAVPLLAPAGSAWTTWRLRRALRLLARRSGASVVVVPPRPLLGLRPEAVARMLPNAVVAQDVPQPKPAAAGSPVGSSASSSRQPAPRC